MAFDESGDGKSRPAHDLPLPADASASALATSLADLRHESARPDRTDVRLLQPAGTVVFDFDSTLIREESLEALVAPRLESDPGLRQSFERITAEGMSGARTFEDSLAERLRLARPGREDVRAFAGRLPNLWTSGMPELVQLLVWRGVEVWIVSGGFRDCLLPAARALGVPDAHVRGVSTVWDEDGVLVGPAPDDPWSRSKVAGLAAETPAWQAPSVMVGDGATDRAVWEVGHAGTFVAFTANVRRATVVEGAPHQAGSAAELDALLGRLVP